MGLYQDVHVNGSILYLYRLLNFPFGLLEKVIMLECVYGCLYAILKTDFVSRSLIDQPILLQR